MKRRNAYKLVIHKHPKGQPPYYALRRPRSTNPNGYFDSLVLDCRHMGFEGRAHGNHKDRSTQTTDMGLLVRKAVEYNLEVYSNNKKLFKHFLAIKALEGGTK